MNALSRREVCERMLDHIGEQKHRLHDELARFGPPKKRDPHAPQVSSLNFQVFDLVVQQHACISFFHAGMYGHGLLAFFEKERQKTGDPSLDLIVATLASETRALRH